MFIHSLHPTEPGQYIEVHAFEFASEADLIEAKRLIDEHSQSGSTGPITLPNGEQIGLDPYITWMISMLVVVD